MTQKSERDQKNKRLNGTIWSIIVLGIMVIALVVIVMTVDRSNSNTAIAVARTATYLQTLQAGTATLDNQAYPISLPAEVNVNGILIMGDPNLFGPQLYLQKVNSAPVAFPLTHGFAENSRGLGAAEMAWSIRAGRMHRASKEMAMHVFETRHGVMISAGNGMTYEMTTRFETPAALPEGYIGDGGWTSKEESALI